ncbi:hypothetical protein ABXT21_16515 [Ralstonia sp. SM1864_UCD524_TZ4]|uniref:Uncharacterized protein n=1 Tax=Ralstonia solanacearum TaxID=305 RepID=A0A0S4VR31_RALSL|nr:hypothetical protein [Ralstonia pseudosolanacearum]CUV23052.1 protein of unknown function [Ralstonia solanacearum]CUV36859.1 protein of unknown function [Ralstonia solanacearum]CUV41629.1 protein of unknown function [Ralstonia solanacearum]CUV59598.1 protein of unknown function [Ralstonia solanacearum]
MAYPDFAKLDDLALKDSALDESLGFARAKAIVALANRALKNPDLLDNACKAISSDRTLMGVTQSSESHSRFFPIRCDFFG